MREISQEYVVGCLAGCTNKLSSGEKKCWGHTHILRQQLLYICHGVSGTKPATQTEKVTSSGARE